jgi:hypothetical protein
MRQGVVTKFLIIQPSKPSRHLASPRPKYKYPPRHPVLEQPQSVFLPKLHIRTEPQAKIIVFYIPVITLLDSRIDRRFRIEW